MRVEDAMLPAPELTLDGAETVSEAVKRTNSAEADFFLIRLATSGWASITQKQLGRLLSEHKEEVALASFCDHRLPLLYPDVPLEMALRQVYRTELIPVVSRVDVRKLEGVISRDAVLAKYKMIGTEDELST